jgi:hypothetical protein
MAFDEFLEIDVVGDCESCSYAGIGWRAFLEWFPEHLPHGGAATYLRIRTGSRTETGLLLLRSLTQH